MSHLVEMIPVEALAAQDPFGGSGLFLEMPDSADAIMEALGEAFGPLSIAVAWPGRGAWIDLAAMELSWEDALRAWGLDAPGQRNGGDGVR